MEEDIMDALLGLGIIIWLIIFVFWSLIPCIITAVVMSNKGQNGGIGALLGFFLGWIGVIVGCCMRNLKDEERRHRETLSVISLRDDFPPILPPPLSEPPALDFRSEAIRNLEVLGKSFDEYDIELEMNKLKSKHLKAEALRRANLERERSLGVVSSSGVVPPPLPSSAPSLSSSPPPLPGGLVVSPLDDREEPDFRIEAIRNLKAAGKVFDEYDIELEMEEVKSAYIRKLKADKFSGAGSIC